MARSIKEIEQELKEAKEAAAATAGGGARTILNVALDLGDSAQVALAKAAGLINLPDAGGDSGDSGDGGSEEETPNRGGYFG